MQCCVKSLCVQQHACGQHVVTGHNTSNKMDQRQVLPAYALSISQSAVTGVTAREAQPANLGPAAALISRWLFLLPRDVVYLPPMMVTMCDMLIFTSSGYDDTVSLHTHQLPLWQVLDWNLQRW